jgi:hypothetical protein
MAASSQSFHVTNSFVSHKHTQTPMAKQVSSSFLGLVDIIDDFYFSVLSDDENDLLVHVSDHKYAEALLFQETLMASVTTTSHQNLLPFPCLASSSKTEQIKFTAEDDEASLIIICEICVEAKRNEEMFKNVSSNKWQWKSKTR